MLRMRSSAKQGGGAAENNRGISGHILTVHQRLHHALKLGCRSWENKKKWHCSDIEIQKLVLRSSDAFLDCISNETLNHPLVKDSIVDIVAALESILGFKSQSILILASNVAVKMVNILPSSMLQSHHVLDLICPLADLLASQQLQVAISCAAALNVILSKIRPSQEKMVREVLKETKAVFYLVHNVKQFSYGDKPIEYFQESACALSKILWRWPSFRYHVWIDSEFINVLDAIKLMSENSVKVAVLQLYSTLALCCNGAEKLLENGEALLRMMVRCMDNSNTHQVRIEAFKLARCLALTERGRSEMMNICCGPLVKAVIDAMRNWGSPSEKLEKSQVSIVEESCRLASITRWPGDFYLYFWRGGLDNCLLDLLLNDYQKIEQLQPQLSVKDLIIIVREHFDAKPQLSLRPHIMDILGMLATYFAENIKHEMHGNELRLKILIICACFSFIDSIGTSWQVSQIYQTRMTEGESAARAILMVVYSPCKYIASLGTSILHEILKSGTNNHVEYLLKTLNTTVTGNGCGLPGDLQILVCLMSLAFYCSLPKYRKLIIKSQGMKILVAFIRWWLNYPILAKRASMVPHLQDLFSERRCCLPGTEDWEGEDILLLISLWILAELLHHSAHGKGHPSDYEAEFGKAQLIQELLEIGKGHYSPGTKWCAAYVLSHFGLFGFPSKLGQRIGKLLGDNEHTDMKLTSVNQDGVYVHEIILRVRCPFLLPPGESVIDEKSCGSTDKQVTKETAVKAVRLSAQVDQQALLKLLEYVYLGYIQTTDDLIKKLIVFAKHCKLGGLLQVLHRKNPKWGIPVPCFDLSPALGPTGLNSANLILESDTTQLENWKCNNCPSLVPHLHAHKIILESSCDYLRALFRSGMQESQMQTIKVPVSWESLNKLVTWFYSDQLPKPRFDCSWDNLGLDEKCREVQPYLELCWLSEFWFIEDLHEECYEVVVSCLNSAGCYLSTKLIQVAASLSQWKLAQVAANNMASSYHRLRSTGELDELDKNLVEMIRMASVKLSQEGSQRFS